MSQTFQTLLKINAQSIQNRLSEILPKPTGPQARIKEAMRYAALGGGKRMRPFLVVETAKMLGFKNQTSTIDSAIEIACALECVHVYSLVHDDLPCMDDDDIRHGQPTLHKQYDEAIAVLAGDGLLTLAFEILAGIDGITGDQKVNLVQGLAQASGTNGMIGGQVMDIMAEQWGGQDKMDIALITQLQAMKTGALIEYGLQAGGILSGASQTDFDHLKTYGQALGLAFQIRDDVLDHEGSAEMMGKAVGKDADLGKATFVSIYGLEQAKAKAQALCVTAKTALSSYGDRAEPLQDCADFVLYRQK